MLKKNSLLIVEPTTKDNTSQLITDFPILNEQTNILIDRTSSASPITRSPSGGKQLKARMSRVLSEEPTIHEIRIMQAETGRQQG